MLLRQSLARTAFPHNTHYPYLAGASSLSRRSLQVRGMAGSAIKDKVVVVTGANRGLGLEWARQLVSKGNKVIGSCRNPSEAAELQKLGVAHIAKLDVADPSSIESWGRDLAGQVDHIDVVINNAGVYGRRVDYATVTADDMLFTYRANTIGPLLIVQQLLKNRLIGKPGSVVGNVTSKVGSVEDNGSGGSYAYRASKSALNNVNKSLSIDLGSEGVTCVLLHPGYVRTDMTGQNGLIDVDESVSGMMSVLESDLPLNGRWYDFKRETIPW
ncbi:hypothetical protein ABBQ32_000688 [Trebouxia sp. C0010 RCD-2024]